MTLDDALSVFARAGLSGKVGYFDVATAQALADVYAELDAARPLIAIARQWRETGLNCPCARCEELRAALETYDVAVKAPK